MKCTGKLSWLSGRVQRLTVLLAVESCRKSDLTRRSRVPAVIEVTIRHGTAMCYRCGRQIMQDEKAYRKTTYWKRRKRGGTSHLCVKCYGEVAI